MKQILIMALTILTANAFAQNSTTPVVAPMAKIVTADNAPVSSSKIPGSADGVPELKPVLLPLQISGSPSSVDTPTPVQKDLTPGLKGVAVDANTQRGMAPKNTDRPKGTTLATNKNVEVPVAPASTVAKIAKIEE